MVADGTVFLTDDDGLRALDSETGAESWRRPETGALFVLDGRLYVSGEGAAGGATVHALDATGGRQEWRTELSEATAYGLTEAEGVVYVETHEGIVGLHADSGEKLWGPTLGDDSRICIGESGPYASQPGGVGALTGGDRFARVFNSDPGLASTVGIDRRLPSSPVADGSRLYVAGTLYGDQQGESPLTAVNFDKQEVVWQQRFEGGVTAPAVSDDLVAVTRYPSGASESGGGLHVLDRPTGDELWSRTFDSASLRPVIAGRTLLAAGSENGREQRAFAFDIETAEQLWTIPVRGEPNPSLIPVEDRLLVGDSRAVRCFF